MKKILAALLAATVLSPVVTPAAHAEGIKQFNVGVLGGENAQDRVNSNECYRKKIEDTLGVPVKLFTPADYDGVIQGLLGGTIDAAVLGASGYAKIYLTDPKAVSPVLTTEGMDGSLGYYSVGIARKDSGIKSLADMKGKVMGFGDPNSTSGYLIPSVEFKAQGISTEPGAYFKDVKFTGGHEQTIVAVKNKDIDGGVTWADAQGNWEDGYNVGALRKAVDAGLIDMNDYVQIWKSKLIPNGPLVIRNALPEDVKKKVIDLTTGLDKDCAYGVAGGEIKGFVPVTKADYDSIIEARKMSSK